MKRLWSLMMATILLIACSSCFVGVEHDRQGRYDGDHDGYRHDDQRGPGPDDRRDHDGWRGPDDRR